MQIIKLHIIIDTRAIVVLRNKPSFVGSSTFIPSGWELIEAMLDYIRIHKNVLINRLSAEYIVLSLCSTHPLLENNFVEVTGRNLNTGLPDRIQVSAYETRDAIGDTLALIIHNIVQSISVIVSSLTPDTVIDNTVTLGGEFRNLQNLAQSLEDQLRMKCRPDTVVTISDE